MITSNAQILHHFYSLLLEMNFYDQEDGPYMADDTSDEFINKHLRLIRLRTAKNKALLTKNLYQSLILEMKRLRDIGAEELRKFLTPDEAIHLQPLFNKFESMSKKEEESIIEDEELLQLLRALKNRLEQSGDDK